MFLFNDALNTFYLRLYGVRHMVKDHSDSEKGNPLPPHRLLLLINSKGSFICTIRHSTGFFDICYSIDIFNGLNFGVFFEIKRNSPTFQLL